MKTTGVLLVGVGVGCLLICSPVQATRYVSPTGGNVPPYTSWASAARDIQTALNAAAAGETIHVSNGTYNISAALDLRDGKILRSVNGSAVTTIHSDHSARCVKIQNHGVLDGFSLRNGRSHSSDGGGVYVLTNGTVRNCDIRECSAGLSGGGVALVKGGLVEYCRIIANHADDPGGGIAIYQGGTVRHCQISSNGVAGPALNWGGGVAIRDDGLVEFCQITDNSAELDGGGIHIIDGGHVRNCVIRYNRANNGGGVEIAHEGWVQRCLISQNTATGAWPNAGQGGGIRLQGTNSSSAQVENCRLLYNYAADRAGGLMLVNYGRVLNSEVSYNTAAYYGGGLFLQSGGYLRGCTIVRNSATQYRGGGVHCWNGGTLLNSIIYYNSAGLGNANYYDENGGGYYRSCCIPSIPAASLSIITNAPDFLNAFYDFRLNPPSSPLVGMGLDTGSTPWECDVRGNCRAIAGASDIGAYEAYGAVNNLASGSGRSDLTTYRDGQWYFRRISGGLAPTTPWGYPGAFPIAAKFSRDIRLDPTVVDPNTGKWYMKNSSNQLLHWGFNWGWQGATLFAGDYDGDGADDLVAFDPGAATWYIYSFSQGVIRWASPFGFPGVLPVSGDYDGDGRDDLAVFHPPSGIWYIGSLANNTPIVWGRVWGYGRCVPVSGDYDGDGCDDLAVYDTDRGRWFIRTASDYPLSGAASPVLVWDQAWGFAGGIPLAGDYDYDGKADLAVYAPGTQQFFIRTVSGTALAWGIQSPASGTGPAWAVRKQ